MPSIAKTIMTITMMPESIAYQHVTCLLPQSSLPHEDTVIFVVSTTGQGDTPDSMKVVWNCYEHYIYVLGEAQISIFGPTPCLLHFL